MGRFLIHIVLEFCPSSAISVLDLNSTLGLQTPELLCVPPKETLQKCQSDASKQQKH